ncbi:peptidylprolyl isomerase [Aquisalimonas asiatica]|uniref:peptidylprolyl isomerase n=1 Tax=Aquisalimonas asiatica TaxID=406100 RepID=A0A1H8PVH1_9GAMM|nr:peptidylprolyl isomerase [Aquisalimonas asiatica]SEO45945.1 peptidyl-prolyl cis-trans isomerase C [Aquisalimonas asiatica]
MSIHVNGKEITSRAINIESAYHQESGADPRYAQRRAAVALTVRELLRQRAEQLDMAVPEDDDDLDPVIDELIATEVHIPTADDTTCRRWYEQNPERFRTPDMAEVRHILLAGHPEDLEERNQARATAEQLIEELRRDPDAFADLARKHSRCPSANEGGHLGQVSNGETVPEFEDAVLRLPVGLADQPIKTRYGFHVVEVLQHVAGEQLPFEAVHERIREYLEAVSRQRAISQYIKLLAGDAEIRGIDLDQAESMLIQ